METAAPSKPAKRDISLDFLRGIAILMVITAHNPIETIPGSLPSYLSYPGKTIGGYGVDLFFVLSGFLIGGLLLREYGQREDIDGVRFLKRRAYKLWPNYFVYVLMAGVILNPSRAKAILPNFLHLQNYIGTNPLAQTWSLAVEEHFYLFLVVAMCFMARRGKLHFENIVKLCLGMIAFCFTARVVGYFLHESLRLQLEATHSRLDTLAVGILVAAIYRLRPEIFEQIARQRALLVTLGIVALAYDWFIPLQSFWMLSIGFDVLAIGAASWVILIFSAQPGVGFLGKARETRLYSFVAEIGFFSYGIYLWHRTGVPVYTALEHRIHLSHNLNWVVGSSFYAITGIIVGVLATKFIEQPMLAIREIRLPAPGDLLAVNRESPAAPGELGEFAGAGDFPDAK